MSTKSKKYKTTKPSPPSPTFHPAVHNICCLFRGVVDKPVVPQQHKNLIGVNEMSGHKGHLSKRHLEVLQ